MMQSFFLSQGHLSILEFCPRKYQYIYVDHLTTPLSLEQQRSLQWGSQFHQLMQQRSLGLPLDDLLALSPHPGIEANRVAELGHCLDILAQQEPTVFGDGVQDFMQADFLQDSEHSRSFLWLSWPDGEQVQQGQPLSPDRWVLRVIYDRLLLTSKAAQILDWKTYPQPKHSQWIRQSWQTRLYLFVLVETSAYTPEQVSMTYWFVRHYNDRGELAPQSYQVQYDRHAHEQTRADLSVWIDRLTHYYRDYQAGSPFPMLPESAPQCQSCPFNQRCERSVSADVDWKTLTFFAE
jgi:hypothetical protein